MKKFYTIDQVNRHNKKNDAWIVYRGNVYNITNEKIVPRTAACPLHVHPLQPIERLP